MNGRTFNHALCVIVVLAGVIGAGTSSAQSIWDGVYTTVQAERGAADYSARCASCHANDLRGNSNSPGLVGMSFMFLWEGRTLGELYTKMRREMPSDQPGSLSTRSYADILSFILSSNQFPSGDAELTSNAADLDKIPIVPR